MCRVHCYCIVHRVPLGSFIQQTERAGARSTDTASDADDKVFDWDERNVMRSCLAARLRRVGYWTLFHTTISDIIQMSHVVVLLREYCDRCKNAR